MIKAKHNKAFVLFFDVLFIAQRVNNLVFKRKMHVMMLEEELHKRSFLRKLGAFSIRKNSLSALHSLKYATKILSKPKNLLLLFPQGSFQSAHRYPALNVYLICTFLCIFTPI